MREDRLRGRDVVVLSSIDWSFLWQGHQEISSRFAAMGNRVFFVENTGVRTVRWTDLGRIVRRLRRAIASAGGAAPRSAPGVTVVPPLLLPFPRSHVARLLNRSLLIPLLGSRLRALGVRDPVLFSFLPTPDAVRLVEVLADRRSVVVYYCIADFQELSDLGPELDTSEEALARRADLVFVQSERFARRLAPFNNRIHEFHFGVNLDVFDRSKTVVNERLAHLPRPIIGYSGGLHRYVDFRLLQEVARAHPKGSLVLVGPVQTDPGPLRNEPNVHFLGSVGIEQLPSYVAGFDVALVPYSRAAYTETVFPTKLFEYLAMGRPVVSTDLPEVRKLQLPDYAARLAQDSETFLAAINASLSESDGALPARRAVLARERDWWSIVGKMAELIADAALA